MENFVNVKYEKQINSINDRMGEKSSKIELNDMHVLQENNLNQKITQVNDELDYKMDEKAVRALIELIEKRKEPP